MILWPAEGPDPARLGGKAAALLRIAAAGLPVPPWCVATEAADDDAIRAAARRLSPEGGTLAVRSSGRDEDGVVASFAGQFESVLDVAPDDVPAAVARVRASGHTDRIRSYRAERGLGPPVTPAALIQRMVRPTAAGVAFTADPVTRRTDRVLVEAVAGLADRLVSGEADAERWVFARDGLAVAERPPDADPVLPEAPARAVAAAALTLADVWGCPLDVEWAWGVLDDGRPPGAAAAAHPWIVQARPITTLAQAGTGRRLWDNSNIVESYPGVSTALTASFARLVYEQVYRQFARVVGVSPRRIEGKADQFRVMVGWVRGRVIYNLDAWYETLALLPGFRFNARAMEQMMGVDRSRAPAAATARLGVIGAVREGLSVAAALLGVLGARLGLGGRVRAFHARVAAALAVNPDPAALGYDALVVDFRRLERDLVQAWSVPLVNDLWCMLALALARGAAKRWAGDADGALLNAALAGQGGIVSAEPARLLRELAALVPPDLRARHAQDPTGFAAALRAHPEAGPKLAAYLDRFGDRTPGELKLETPTLVEDPAPVLAAIAATPVPPGAPHPAPATGPSLPQDDEAADRLRRRPLLRLLIAEAKARIRDRENLRFERTRVFGRVRRLCLEMGRRLQGAGLLPDARAALHLRIEELLGLAEGTVAAPSLAAIAAARAAEYAGFLAQPPPPRRFETAGAVALCPPLPVPHPASGTPGGPAEPGLFRGLGCSPGLIRARARVVRDPATARFGAGEILVASFTDPGWVVLFARAGGIAVERGSLLSHSAIVARELRIPAVVGIPDLLERMPDGALVELDGAAGTVRVMEGGP